MNDKDLAELGAWCADEYRNGSRTKASKIYRILKKHFFNRYPRETEEFMVRYYGIK